MKKVLYLLFIVPIIVFSCKKEHSASTLSPSGKKYKLNFNVTNFTQKQGGFSVGHKAVNSLTDVGNYLDVLYYVVLDDHNNPVKKKYQDSTMADMGTIVDSLPPGNYTIGIAAGKKDLMATATFGIGSFFDYGNNPWEDTFFASFPLSVGNTNITKDVTLARVVGKLEISLLDTIPAMADTLVVSFDGDATVKGFLDGSAGNHRTTTIPFVIPATAKGKPNFTVDMLIGGTDFGSDVTMTAKGPGNHVIVSTTYSPVTIFPNEKTILSGKLFQGVVTPPSGGNQSFTVKIDTAWGGTTHISF